MEGGSIQKKITLVVSGVTAQKGPFLGGTSDFFDTKRGAKNQHFSEISKVSFEKLEIQKRRIFSIHVGGYLKKYQNGWVFTTFVQLNRSRRAKSC